MPERAEKLCVLSGVVDRLQELARHHVCWGRDHFVRERVGLQGLDRDDLKGLLAWLKLDE